MPAILRVTLPLTLFLLAARDADVGVKPPAAMMRFPDVSATHVVFLYANDLWLVPREGGTAIPLASPPGEEQFPKFSPDGATIAFMGNYDGNSDLYTIPVNGGTPFRVTHHPTREVLTEWTADGDLIFFSGGMGAHPRTQELFHVSSRGGLPQEFPVPYGANGTVSLDGKWLAYTPNNRDHRTWKRYRGGMAADIWLFHLTRHTSKKITDWEGTDSQPMWHDKKIYYLSDAGAGHRLNLWVYDTRSEERRQVTSHTDYDVKWPSVGPGAQGKGEIVYQLGPDLHLLDLESEKWRSIDVTLPGHRAHLRPQMVDVADLIFSRNLSSTGKRAVVGARGDIWTLPAKKGSVRNLTRSSGVAERDPSWSPDGKWIAYFSDVSGTYELYISPSDGVSGETRQLTYEDRAYLYSPTWSPDSKHIALWDKAGALLVHSLDQGSTRVIDENPAGTTSSVSWSSDSSWLAYTLSQGIARPSTLWLHHLPSGKSHRVTEEVFSHSFPTFDREGKYLYVASNRDFSAPIYEDLGTTWVYAGTQRLYAVPLRRDVASPLAPESDEETWDDKDGEGSEEKPSDDDGADEEKGKNGEDGEDGEETAGDDDTVEIDLDGFERRMVELPVEKGVFRNLAVNDQGKLLYSRVMPRGMSGEASIHILDLDAEKEKEETVLKGTGRFRMSADGKKLLIIKDDTMAVVEARAKQKMEDRVSTAGMKTLVDPREEWRQIFHEAWRLQRDFFYDPNMHGVDWGAVRDQYEAMLDHCTSREDVSYLIGEMIAELNVGHAYYLGGDVESAPRVPVGMLGCDFELDSGAYRIARIYEGGVWDVESRGPLSQPGIDVQEGDYLLAVNHVPLDTGKDPWAAFQDMAGRTVTLTVSDRPTLDEDAREVVVELERSEFAQRYRAWVEKNRAYVAEETGGRVGYVYVPDTGTRGQNELVRQLYGQLDTEALIIDERWNGGGQVPTRFIELLNRPLANYWARRDGRDWVWPPDAHYGPKCMLINGMAGSGGDYFPFWFKASGVGKLIGTRTWGGLVGIPGNPRLIDGGRTTVPAFAFYEKDGTWGIEGHGVDPDIEVLDDPALMVDGGDPQLDAAIAHMLEELEKRPYRHPPRPPYPDRSGMGLPQKDH